MNFIKKKHVSHSCWGGLDGRSEQKKAYNYVLHLCGWQIGLLGRTQKQKVVARPSADYRAMAIGNLYLRDHLAKSFVERQG